MASSVMTIFLCAFNSESPQNLIVTVGSIRAEQGSWQHGLDDWKAIHSSSNQEQLIRRRKHIMNRFKLAQWLLLALLAVFAFGKVEAQATSGTAVGAVTDSTQSAVVGAHVTLTNSGTGDKRTATTNSTGGYQFVNVAPGTYKIDVEAAGFKHYTQI